MKQFSFAEEKVLRFVREKNLIPPGSKIICGLSGGADSSAMVSILKTLSEELKITLVCAHLNHMIRGAEAERDESFAENFSAKLGLAFYSEHKDIPRAAKELGISEEDAGRRARYSFFGKLTEKLCANLIATAHNRDDNAETVLMHIVRGCGIEGLRGIEPARDNIIRPVLCLTRTEIETYCKEKGIDYVTDSTNLETDYTRNKFRLEVLPLLKEINPSVADSLCRLADNASETYAFLCSHAEKTEIKGGEISLSSIENISDALYPLTLKRMLESAGLTCELSDKTVTAAKNLVKNGKVGSSIDIGGGVCLTKTYGSIKAQIKQKTEKFEYTLKSGEILKINGFEFFIANSRPEGLALNADGAEKITLRSRRNGDRIIIGGMTRKLQDLFVNKKIERSLRDSLVIADFDGTPVWAEKIGAADGFTTGKAKKYLVIKHTEGM